MVDIWLIIGLTIKQEGKQNNMLMLMGNIREIPRGKIDDDWG